MFIYIYINQTLNQKPCDSIDQLIKGNSLTILIRHVEYDSGGIYRIYFYYKTWKL